MIIKAILIGLLLALGEVVNGNVRVRLLHHLLGKKRAKTVSFFSGSVLIFALAWFALPWVSPVNYTDCFIIGFIWLVMLLTLDLYFGRYVFKFKWQKISADFNPLKGNLLSFGMLFVFFSPCLIFWLRH